jgi:hypothetical protein
MAMPAEHTQPHADAALSDQVRLELTRLLMELSPMPLASFPAPPAPLPAREHGTFTTETEPETEMPPRVTRGDIALALGRPARASSFRVVGVTAAVLFIGAWLVSAWAPMMPVRPDDSAVRAAATRPSSDPSRMTQVQSALDVVHLWAQGGAGSAQVIRGQMWWSPSEGMALWARAEPLSGRDGLGYQAWLVSDRGTQYLGPITADPAGTISVSFDPPFQTRGRPVRVLVTLQSPARVEQPADRVVLEARF